MGPRQPRRQQALRPVRARTADRDRQQFPRRPREFRPRRARARIRARSARPPRWSSWAQRIGCARCHAHPQESWTLDDDLGLGAFFARVNYKATLEWKEEIVYTDFRGTLRHPRTRAVVEPRFPGAAAAVKVAAEEDPRGQLAAWLTVAGESVFRQGDRQPHMVLAAGTRHHPRARRSASHQSAVEPGTAGVSGERTHRAPVRPAPHLSPDSEFADLSALQRTQPVERARHQRCSRTTR